MSTDEAFVLVRRHVEELHDRREIVVPDLLEQTRRATDLVLAAFPDYRITVEDQVAEEDKVATV